MSETPHLTAALSDRYVIQRELGSGGMAVVYLAHDRKLDRDVALKLLRPELGAVLGAERFLTEIKISARLDHPHILTLIDSGDADGMLYYVLPYVRGETLRDKLNREHQLALDDAFTITKQVASALDYAHRQGLVHRDIKPENILLQEGEAMLTDFGIALAVKEAGGNRLTQTGLSLGTPQYMSPEQATGDRTVDGRSDVYSLASVLYEMLVGEPPVTGANAQVMIAKLMTERPTHVRVLRDTVPQAVDDAIAKALSKTPADRFASAGDFVRALEAGLKQPASATGAGPAATAPRRSRLTIATAAVVIAAIAVGVWAMRRPSNPVVSSQASLSSKTQLTVSGGISYPAISPDGKQLAFVERHCKGADCTYSIVVEDVGGATTRSILDGATSMYDLRWSPDRRNLIMNGAIDGRDATYMLSALGGPPKFLTLGAAAFYADGDSLLIGPSGTQDSVYWVGVAGLDGVVHDSIPVRGKGQYLGSLSAIPGTRWILALIVQSPHGLWQVIGRDGTVADHVVNQCTCGGIGTVDAVWLDRAGDAAGESLVRIAIDPKTGRLSAKQDTMVTGRFTNVSVTADGSRMVMDQGTLDYRIWTGAVPQVLAGQLGAERIAQASSSVLAWISPNGQRLLVRRVVPTTGSHTEARFSIRSYDGGAEAPLAESGKIRDATWVDSNTVSAIQATPQGRVHLGLIDVTTGAERDPLDLADSSIADATPIPGGWAYIPVTGASLVLQTGGTQRTVSRPSWFNFFFDVIADSAHGRVFVAGYNRATNDSLGVAAVDVSTGAVTKWGATFAENGSISLLDGGASGVLMTVHHTEERINLYKLTGPGAMQSLGSPAVPLFWASVSGDLKRATAVERTYNADAWMYTVVKR